MQAQLSSKLVIGKEKREAYMSSLNALKTSLSDSQCYAMTLAQEKGASIWLTSLPLEEYGFSLHKGAFRDALALRYGWLPSNQM